MEIHHVDFELRALGPELFLTNNVGMDGAGCIEGHEVARRDGSMADRQESGGFDNST